MRIQWTADAQESARRYLADQDGMLAVNAAVEALRDDPEPDEAFIRGRYHRLRVGSYRVQYAVEADLIAILRIDRVG